MSKPRCRVLCRVWITKLLCMVKIAVELELVKLMMPIADLGSAFASGITCFSVLALSPLVHRPRNRCAALPFLSHLRRPIS
jgi:hypothetical protein